MIFHISQIDRLNCSLEIVLCFTCDFFWIKLGKSKEKETNLFNHRSISRILVRWSPFSRWKDCPQLPSPAFGRGEGREATHKAQHSIFSFDLDLISPSIAGQGSPLAQLQQPVFVPFLVSHKNKYKNINLVFQCLFHVIH